MSMVNVALKSERGSLETFYPSEEFDTNGKNDKNYKHMRIIICTEEAPKIALEAFHSN